MESSNQRSVREHYLQRLGIVQYVSRASNSALSDEDHKAPTNAKSTSVENPARSSSILEAMGESTANSKSSSSTKKAKVEQKQTPEKVSINLRFALWQATDDILVCCVINEPMPDLKETKLLTNIITAMDNQVSKLPNVDVINWPPHNNMQGDEAEIRDYFATIINTRVKAKSSSKLLLMGEEAQEWVLMAEQREQAEEGSVAIADNLTALLVPSLQDMLDQPDLKRLTWHAISRHCKPS
jgi:hypothetical protein